MGVRLCECEVVRVLYMSAASVGRKANSTVPDTVHGLLGMLLSSSWWPCKCTTWRSPVRSQRCCVLAGLCVLPLHVAMLA